MVLACIKLLINFVHSIEDFSRPEEPPGAALAGDSGGHLAILAGLANGVKNRFSAPGEPEQPHQQGRPAHHDSPRLSRMVSIDYSDTLYDNRRRDRILRAGGR